MSLPVVTKPPMYLIETRITWKFPAFFLNIASCENNVRASSVRQRNSLFFHLKVEDFINDTSPTSMSSVPIQFLIYVLPPPTCSDAPIILPLAECLEVAIGVPMTFNLSVLNLCDPNVTEVIDIIIPQGITGMQASDLTISSTNASLVYETFTWTPQADQIGSQQLCAVAYTR